MDTSGGRDPRWGSEPRRWQLKMPAYLQLILGLGVGAAGMSFLHGSQYLGVAIGAVLLLLTFAVRPAIGLLITFAIYVPDQIITAVTGSSMLTPGRILPVLAIAVSVPLLMKRPVLPLTTRPYLIALFALVGWYWLMLAFWTSPSAFSYVAQLTLLCIVAIPLIVLFGRPDRAAVICLSQAVAGAMGAAYMLFGGGAKYAGSAVRLTYEGLGINSISIMLGLSIIAALGYMHIGKNKMIIMSMLPVAMFIYAAVLRTGTRSVIWGVPLAIGLAYMIASGRKFYKYWIASAVVIVAVIVIMNVANDRGFIEGRLFERIYLITEDTGVISSNSRYGFWDVALDWYMANPLGAGPGTVNELRAVTMGSGSEAHNTFISTLIQVNLIGLLLLSCALVGIGIMAFRIQITDYRILSIALYIYMIMQFSKGSVLQTRLFWYPIVLIVVVIEAASLVRRSYILSDRGKTLPLS